MIPSIRKFLTKILGDKKEHEEECFEEKNKPSLEVRIPKEDPIISIANRMKEGEVIRNKNWIRIEELGEYLSPIGNDPIHTVEVYQRRMYSNDELLCSFQSTNFIYTEWVQVVAESMWHVKSKVLKDIKGRKYFVGDMCESRVMVKYDDIQ